MMIFDDEFNRRLLQQAAQSPRLRSHHNLHRSFDESVQRLYIAILRGSYIPPHWHANAHQWEFFQVICGVVKLLVFDKTGRVTDIFLLGQGQGCHAVQLPPGTIHTLVCLSDEAVIFELKQGPFNPDQAKEIPSWSVAESNCHGADVALQLERITVGERL